MSETECKINKINKNKIKMEIKKKRIFEIENLKKEFHY